VRDESILKTDSDRDQFTYDSYLHRDSLILKHQQAIDNLTFTACFALLEIIQNFIIIFY
jgi:hypothetical protein